MSDGKVVTSGGRVLCATAMGDTVSEAQSHAYELAGTILTGIIFICVMILVGEQLLANRVNRIPHHWERLC